MLQKLNSISSCVSRPAKAELPLVRETISLLAQGAEPKQAVFAGTFKNVQGRLEWFITDGEGATFQRGKAALLAKYDRIDMYDAEATFAELTDFHRFRFLGLLSDEQQSKVAGWTKNVLMDAPPSAPKKDDLEEVDATMGVFS